MCQKIIENTGSTILLILQTKSVTKSVNLQIAVPFARRNTKNYGDEQVRAGIHFPHTPFSARPTRGVWSYRAVRAALVSRSTQNRFGFGCIMAPFAVWLPNKGCFDTIQTKLVKQTNLKNFV